MSTRERVCGAPAGVLLSLAVLAFIVALLVSCGTPGEAAPAVTDPTPPDTVAVAPPPVPTTAVIAVAAALAMAEPLVERTTTLPPDPCGPDAVAYVNNLPYQRAVPEPALDAYRLVATCLGWAPEVIAKWEQFIVFDIFPGESDYCPFRVGGDWVGPNCEVLTVGHASDTGFFQLISLWYKPGGSLCVQHGYCGQQSILATAWDSMRAGLLAIMIDGRGPWSYNDFARRHHPLWSTVPRYWP